MIRMPADLAGIFLLHHVDKEFLEVYIFIYDFWAKCAIMDKIYVFDHIRKRFEEDQSWD